MFAWHQEAGKQQNISSRKEISRIDEVDESIHVDDSNAEHGGIDKSRHSEPDNSTLRDRDEESVTRGKRADAGGSDNDDNDAAEGKDENDDRWSVRSAEQETDPLVPKRFVCVCLFVILVYFVCVCDGWSGWSADKIRNGWCRKGVRV